ncbi:MAG: nicotinamide-nucleotide amidohydrolase family protein [Myxococcota bacterium]
MRIVFLAIGDELLRGESREGNGAVLSDRLGARGVRLDQIRVLRDDFETIASALQDLCRTPTLIVVSGGLGPTDDDFTRAAVARAVGVEVVRDESVLDGLRAWYQARGRTMAEANHRQADFPQGAEVLANLHGTAPGFTLVHGAARIACLPGVPREFAAMLDDHLDDLLQRSGVATLHRHEATFRLFGIPESDLQVLLSRLPHWSAATMRSLPSWPEIRLMLAPRGDSEAFATLLTHVRGALGTRIYSERREDTHAAATLRALVVRGATLAVAESCTGGLIGHLLTEVPGASATLLVDTVTYADDAKREFLGVAAGTLETHGAVSEQTAREMAEGVRNRSGATVAVATTGIAGPAGGTDAKPVGTVFVAVAGPDGTVVRGVRYVGIDRSRFKLSVAHLALAELRSWALRQG